MNILDALKQLRDDIKIWVTNNLNALNSKIDEKIIPIDKELSATSTNPVQNKTITNAINNIPRFSGSYNDLTDAPNISEDESGNMVIADESGNIIFKADADGLHTTAVSLNGEAAASEKYVDEAIANIPKVDFTGYATENYVTSAVNSVKDELSESIIAEAEDWKVVDGDGNIIFSVDAEGAHATELTLNGEAAATEAYVNSAIANIEFPTTDLTGYATETYVDNKVADLVNSAPEALNTLGELAVALENHEDAYDALLETVGSKATHTDLENLKEELSESITAEAEDWKVVDGNGNIIFSVDNTGAHTTNLTLNGEEAATKTYVDEAIDDIQFPETDFTGYATEDYVDGAIAAIPQTDLTGYATEKYVDDAVAAIDIPETDLSDYYTKEQTDTAINTAKEEISESIVAESDEWKVVDEAGNIIFSVDASGAHTTALTLNGESVEDIVDERVASLVDSAPDTLNTLNELAAALGDDPNFATTIATEIGKKIDKVDGKGLSTNDFTNEYKEKLDDLNLDNITFEETDPTVPAWAKAENKPTYTADEVGALSKDTSLFSGDYNDLENAPDISEDDSGDLVIADKNGNIIFRSNGDGFETVNLTVQNITVNGKTIQEMIQDYVNEAILGGAW